jgi:phosphomevalonate kinase
MLEMGGLERIEESNEVCGDLVSGAGAVDMVCVLARGGLELKLECLGLVA